MAWGGGDSFNFYVNNFAGSQPPQQPINTPLTYKILYIYNSDPVIYRGKNRNPCDYLQPPLLKNSATYNIILSAKITLFLLIAIFAPGKKEVRYRGELNLSVRNSKTLLTKNDLKKKIHIKQNKN